MTETSADVVRRMPPHLCEPGELLHWLWQQAESNTELCNEDLALAVYNAHHERGMRTIPIPKNKREAWKKLGRYLDPDTTTNLPFDIALSVVEALPQPYRSAARTVLFPSEAREQADDLDAARDRAQGTDSVTDLHRYRLNSGEYRDSLTVAELRAIALEVRRHGQDNIDLANALDREAAEREEAGRTA